jgi:hypothetical protein
MSLFSELLKKSDDLSDEVCNNPTKAKCRELELITQMAIDVLTEEINKRKPVEDEEQ